MWGRRRAASAAIESDSDGKSSNKKNPYADRKGAQDEVCPPMVDGVEERSRKEKMVKIAVTGGNGAVHDLWSPDLC